MAATTPARVLNRYRLVERLASGGMAEVWSAHDEHLDRPVAVKLLHPHLLPDTRSRMRLASEARAAASLSHRSIVEVYDVDVDGETPALVMELVGGRSLAARLAADGPLDAHEAARVVADVAEGLYHAHQRGIVHRDVKPGNILLDADGNARLVDFGIAHSLARGAERITITGTVVGTPRYMSPEQLAGAPVTPRTDLYGLGLVLYEALAGRPPFADASPVALAQAQATGAPVPDGVDHALATLAVACLAPDPRHRPLHAGAVADAARAWLDGDPAPVLVMASPPPARVDREATTSTLRAAPVGVAAAPAGGAAAAGAAGAVGPGAVRDAPSPDARGDRRLTRAPALLLGLAAVLVGGAILTVLLGQQLPAIGALPGSSASAAPTSLATATPAPEWVAKLIDDYAKKCGDGAVDEVADTISSMNEDEAKDHVESLIDACEEADDDGGQGGGRGQGGGNGSGGGNGGNGGGNGGDGD